MSKLFYNSKEEHILLELDKKDQLDERVFNAMSSNGFANCLTTQYSSKKKAFKYDLSGLVSFKVRLGSTIERDEFYFLLKNWFDSLTNLFNLGIEPNRIDWNADLMFMDSSGRVYFLVYPLKVKSVEGSDIYTILTQIISKSKPLSANDGEVFQGLKDQIEKVNKGILSREQFINALKEVVTTFYNLNLKGFEPKRLHALMNGVETAEERRKREEVKVEVAGVSLDMTGLSVEIQERTSIILPENDEPEFEEDDKTQVLSVGTEHNLQGVLERDSESFTLVPSEDFSTWVLGKKLSRGNADADLSLIHI